MQLRLSGWILDIFSPLCKSKKGRMIYLQYLGSYTPIPYFILSCKRRSKSFPQCKTLHCYSVLIFLKAEGKSLRETAFLTLQHWAKAWRERNSQRAVNGGMRQNDVKQHVAALPREVLGCRLTKQQLHSYLLYITGTSRNNNCTIIIFYEHEGPPQAHAWYPHCLESWHNRGLLEKSILCKAPSLSPQCCLLLQIPICRAVSVAQREEITRNAAESLFLEWVIWWAVQHLIYCCLQLEELSSIQTPLLLKPELRSSDLYLKTFSSLTERKTAAHYAARANSC